MRAITFLYDRIPGSTRGGEKALHIGWRVLWCVAIYVGATQPSQLVWRLGDISNAAMALPNLLALLIAVGPSVFALARGGPQGRQGSHRRHARRAGGILRKSERKIRRAWQG